MEYQDFEERAAGDWVLYLCKRNKTKPDSLQEYSARLYPSMDRFKDRMGNISKTKYRNAAELAKYYNGDDLVDMYRYFNSRPALASSLKGEQLGIERPRFNAWGKVKAERINDLQGPHLEDIPDQFRFERGNAALWLWQLLQLTQDRSSAVNSVNEMDDEEMFTIRLDRMTTDNGATIIAGFNKQKRQICEKLIELGKSKAMEHELKAMMAQACQSGFIKTKQDPWRIFSYYAPELGNEGFVYYPGKRHKLEDHSLNV